MRRDAAFTNREGRDADVPALLCQSDTILLIF